ncbi:MAG: hypothetical protein KC620_04560 [Myxococcales bacterium]|nr:hypothetical protein [Myxococcales bacterium]
MNARASRLTSRARPGDPRTCAPSANIGGSARAAFAHRQALRAVAGVTFTLGLVGCIEDVDSLADPVAPGDLSEVDAEAQVDPDAEAFDAGADEDAEVDMSVWFEDARVLGDAGDALPDAAGDEGVDAAVDASTELPTDPAQCLELMGRGDFEAYNACCEAFGWPPACIAWGPPVPPSMPEAVRA